MTSISKFLMEKTCKYHSNNNSFIYLDSKNKENFTEKVIQSLKNFFGYVVFHIFNWPRMWLKFNLETRLQLTFRLSL